MDREKVIKAYECCKNSFDRICEKCPYEKDCCHDGIPMFVIKKMVELLKDQEPVEPELEGGGYTWWTVCGDCHGSIDVSDNFCKHCGRRIKHEKTE